MKRPDTISIEEVRTWIKDKVLADSSDFESFLYKREGWKPIGTAPQNATWFEGLTKDNEIVEVHYACDLSGEEQPPFKGYFDRSYWQVLDIIKWRPINETT
jgi:hypothetical protein